MFKNIENLKIKFQNKCQAVGKWSTNYKLTSLYLDLEETYQIKKTNL